MIVSIYNNLPRCLIILILPQIKIKMSNSEISLNPLASLEEDLKDEVLTHLKSYEKILAFNGYKLKGTSKKSNPGVIAFVLHP